MLLGVLVSVVVRMRLGSDTGSQRRRNGNVKSSLHFRFLQQVVLKTSDATLMCES